MNNIVDLQLDQIVTLKKPHPSGTKTWTIIKLGSDIKLKSNEVKNTYIILTRTNLLKRIKK